jgi:RNA polymerase sigma factor (sigma-70 family)
VDLAGVYQAEYGRCVATLVRLVGDIGLAEEAVQDAFAVALEKWEVLPPNPGAWIVTTARNRAIDRLRRESTRDSRHEQAVAVLAPQEPEEVGPVQDDQLRLIFTCCHPALAPTAQTALTLRLLGGLETSEIARAYLVPEATVAQRIVRAKKKIREARIPYRIPAAHELPDRLPPVLTVLYLVFNEGYAATTGELIRADLCLEAIRLARQLAGLMPDEPEVLGLLALLLLTESRRPARVTADGSIVRLPDQDRALWDRALIAEGHDLVRRCLHRNQPGPFQIQAAIQAVHTDGDATDWPQVLALYDQLFALVPTAVVALNRAVAVAEVHGPALALALVDDLDLPGFHLLHSTRADLLLRLGRTTEAEQAYDDALALATNDAERAFLRQRRAEI